MITAAEESTAWPGVSRPTYLGGLGFGFKWNMGWMHDTLAYFQHDPIYRRYHHHELTFSLVYAFTENFILPLSHDEVVHGKGSLLTKMPGDRWQKLANLRSLYAYMWAHPGKKLLFMGQEFAQEAEWSDDRSLDWHLLENPEHGGIQSLVRDLNRAYKAEPALWEMDFDGTGFWWIEANAADDNVFAFARRTKDSERVALFVGEPLAGGRAHNYRLGLPRSRPLARGASTPTPATTAAPTSGNLGGVEAEGDRLARPAVLGRGHAAAAGALWLVPEESRQDHERTSVRRPRPQRRLTARLLVPGDVGAAVVGDARRRGSSSARERLLTTVKRYRERPPDSGDGLARSHGASSGRCATGAEASAGRPARPARSRRSGARAGRTGASSSAPP